MKLGRRPFVVGGALVSLTGVAGASQGACGGQVAEPDGEPHRWSPPPTDVPDSSTPPSPPAWCKDPAPNTPLRALTGIRGYPPYPAMTLYSYTTAEQVAGLRNGDPLFTKVTTDSGDRGYLFDILAAVAKRGSAAAALLEGPRYEKGRFAWPFLAGTRISPEDYGDEIIAMTLKPEAIVAYVGAEHGDISFIDSTGSRLTDDEALAIPERIGAVFFFNGEAIFSGTVGSGCYGATTNRAVAYREFYLGNIDMVAEWSLGTQAIVDRLRDEAADLRGLVADLDCTGMVGPSCADIVDAWVLHRDKRVDCILASLAFASESGYPVARLGTLADELEALVFTPNPFVGAGAGSSQP